MIEVTGIPGLDGNRRSLRLTFYDIPGEAATDEGWLVRNASFLPQITDVLFVFDPTRVDFAARALQAAELWDRISRLVARAEQKKFTVALSKMDELRNENEWANTLAEYWPDASPTPANLPTYFGEMDILSAHMRKWWSDRAHGGPGFVNRLHRNTRFCALSSLGHQPIWECTGCRGLVPDAAAVCPSCGAARDRRAPLRPVSQPRPFRVRDSLFWWRQELCVKAGRVFRLQLRFRRWTTP